MGESLTKQNGQQKIWIVNNSYKEKLSTKKSCEEKLSPKVVKKKLWSKVMKKVVEKIYHQKCEYKPSTKSC